MAEAEPTPTDTMVEWLHQLYGDVERGWLTLFALDRRNGARHTPWREVDDIEGLVADATALSDECSVWFGVGVRREKVGGRGKAEHVESIPGLWVDIDIEGPNHKGAHALPKSLDEARSLIADFPIPPTAVVVTGGGLQAWWLLKEPLAVEDGAAELLTQWGHTWAELGRRRGWHVDNVFDLPRVMRLPGTFNRKNGGAHLVTVEQAEWGRRYNPGDLEGHMLDAPEPTRAQPQERVPYIGPQRPGDAFNAQRRGAELLERVGFVFARRDANGDEHFVRPGKDKRDGTSATVYADDGHTTIWSDTVLAQWPALETQRPYDPFGLYCALFHGGDWTAATQELSRQGYGERSIERDDFSWVGTGEAGDAMAEPLTAGWEPPASLGERTLMAFPLDTLPAWMADYCTALAAEIQVPVDLCAQVALGVWSAACAGKAKVAITRQWVEHLNLFTATAMSSGGGKSPVSKRLTAPLRSLEVELVEQSRSSIAAAKAERKVLEKELAKAERDGDAKEAARIYMELDFKDVPRLPRLVVDDVTQEKLSVLLAEQKGRMALISTEATMFDLACGLYSSKAPNNSVYLQGWSADPLIIDRKGASSAEGTEIKIAEPVLTVAITVQPSTIAELRKHPELHGRGFTARFMYSIPPSVIGQRDRYAVLRTGNAEAANAYERTFLSFARRYAAWQMPAVIPFDDGAAETFVAWMQAMEPMLGDDAALTTVREWSSKLHSSVARVAGLLHLADGLDHNTPIGVETITRAIRIGEYWIDHALAIAVIWDGDEITELARAIVQRRFIEEGVTEFDSRDTHRTWHKDRVARIAKDRGIGPRDVAFEILTLLEDGGYIRTTDGGPVQRMAQGKPLQRFVVNPLLRSTSGDRANGATSSPDRAGRAGSLVIEKEKEIPLSIHSSSPLSMETRPTRPIGAEGSEASERPPGWSLIGDPDDEGAA